MFQRRHKICQLLGGTLHLTRRPWPKVVAWIEFILYIASLSISLPARQAINDLINLLKAENVTVISSESFDEDPTNQVANLKVNRAMYRAPSLSYCGNLQFNNMSIGWKLAVLLKRFRTRTVTRTDPWSHTFTYPQNSGQFLCSATQNLHMVPCFGPYKNAFHGKRWNICLKLCWVSLKLTKMAYSFLNITIHSYVFPCNV